MSNDKYNGWKNYETWNVKLWIDNDESTADYWNETASDIYRAMDATEHLTRKEASAYKLANIMKEEFTENAPALEGTYGDLLNAALDAVDWDEIATNIIDGISDEVDEEEKAEKELEAE